MVKLPILPLRDPDLVVFPGLLCEIDVGRSFSIDAVAVAKASDGKIIIAMQREESSDEPKAADFYGICTLAEIRRVTNSKDQDGKPVAKVFVVGTERMILKTVGKTEGEFSYLHGEALTLEDVQFDIDDAIKDQSRQLRELVSQNFSTIVIKDSSVPETALALSIFTDDVAGQLSITGKQKLELLRIKDPRKRLEKLLKLVLDITKQAPINIEAGQEPRQEQQDDEVTKLSKTVETCGMSEEALKVARYELRRLKMMQEHSAEFHVTFNYIESIASLPWNISTEDKLDIDDARNNLDADHYGLDKVKDRIVEFLAIRKLSPKRNGSILCLVGPPGVGKAQPLDAKVLTPNGFVNMGDLKIGDIVSTPDGKNANVIGLFPQGKKDIYSVTFSDGSKTECCKEHLWAVRTRDLRKNGSKFEVKTLDDICKNTYVENGQRKNYSIPMINGKINFESESLLDLDPYLLGALLGDGTLGSVAPNFSNGNMQVVNLVRKSLNKIGCKMVKNGIDYGISKKNHVCVNNIRHDNTSNLVKILKKLDLYGRKADNKFVPEQYKLSSFKNRLALLQGIFDTDGSACSNKHNIEYSSASKQLALDVKFLVESLGGQARYHVCKAYYKYNGKKLRGKDRHRLFVSLPVHIVPFRMKEKIEKYNKTLKSGRFLPRYIAKIEHVGVKEAQCILIDHPDHLYITNDFVVTHNTSIGKSIAKAMGRKFIRLSLGGVHDEAEVRGHRRTYIGAMPGKIIQSLRKVESNNPVFMLDEIDKLCKDYRGDPGAALLEVLDPEQNFSFCDNYINVPFDLSNVLFVVTANETAPIPPALYDRLEVIEIPGYSPYDKIKIAQSYLIPKQKEEKGMKDCTLDFSEKALARIIDEYTGEAGVRSLERECGTIIRKLAVLVASNKEIPPVIEAEEIPKYLGPSKVHAEKAAINPEVGLSTGLAWSRYGGSILFIETVLTPGKGDIKLTGNLGQVLQESITAAITWIKSNSERFGVKTDFISSHDIHVHLPSGAMPKDGPSAGVALTASILSRFTGRPVRNDAAVTGEISLRGRVMPIGGLKEKVLAAHRAGIKEILYPEQNATDLEDIPADVRDDLKLTPINNLQEAIDILLLPQEKLEDTVPSPIGSNGDKTLINMECNGEKNAR